MGPKVSDMTVVRKKDERVGLWCYWPYRAKKGFLPSFCSKMMANANKRNSSIKKRVGLIIADARLFEKWPEIAGH